MCKSKNWKKYSSSYKLWTQLNEQTFVLNSKYQIIVVQSLHHVWLFAASWTAASQAFLYFTISKYVQTHVHWVGDTIQPSHHLSPTFPPALSLSLPQGLFQWAGSSHQVVKVWELQHQHQSFQWIFRTDFLYGWLIWSPCSPRNSQESSSAPQFESIN